MISLMMPQLFYSTFCFEMALGFWWRHNKERYQIPNKRSQQSQTEKATLENHITSLEKLAFGRLSARNKSGKKRYFLLRFFSAYRTSH